MHGLARLSLLLALLGACEPSGARSVAPDYGDAQPTVAQAATSSRPMMIAFSRDFCLPCQVMAPEVAELRRLHAADVDIVEGNIDRERHQPLALFFRVKSVPTQIFVEASGAIVEGHEGLATQTEMVARLKRHGWVR